MSVGNSYGVSGDCQMYVLEQAGWTEGGGTAPTTAASGQQAVNAAVAQGGAAGGPVLPVRALVSAFVGTVGGNTFEPEDVMSGAYYAVSQGWFRPAGRDLFEPAFVLTAAGVAQAT